MRVAHHPPHHPFVDALPVTRGDAALGPVWDVERMVADDVGLVHVHFGFEHLSDRELRTWTEDLATAGVGLVHTAHDLDNPHLTDQGVFHRSVGTLIRAAGALTTLTAAAARIIAVRYGAVATVVPHPHVIPLDEVSRRRRRPRRRHGLYVHVAAGRPNLDLDAVERLVARPDRRPVRVHVRPQAPPATRDRLERLAAQGRIELDVRERLTDAELWDRLAGAELLVLPYQWGTHSGLIEAAHDLGTPTLAPAFGGYRDQGATTFTEDPAPCVAEAAARRPTVTVASRRRQQRAALRSYSDAYQAAAARFAS